MDSLPPSDGMNETAKKQTVPVPYHIPDTMTDEVLNDYEDRCLLHLHHRCLLQRTQGNPVRGMFLELVLASNGTTLSNRYLKKLGELAKHHSFHFVIDEIMTGGRYGVMLLTGTKPEEFVERVGYITLGKWMQAGMVLASVEQRNLCTQKLSGMSPRGASTEICCNEISSCWVRVISKLDKTTERRHQVLERLHVEESDSWGGGVHIFASRRWTCPVKSTKNRFLPLLEETPIDRRLSVTTDKQSRLQHLYRHCHCPDLHYLSV